MSQDLTQASHQQIGAKVGDFRLATLGGTTICLKTLLEGKRGAVVVFWSAVCSHCVRYDGFLNALVERCPALGFLAVASRSGETAEQIRAAVQQRKLLFPIALDPGSLVARLWCTQQTPRAFLVDADGLLLFRGALDNYRYPGDIEYAAYLEPAIAQFLSRSPITKTETASFGCAIDSVYYKFPRAL
ncbi:MAG TPA: redoxin domain-containing protein [Candidatus Angelobacter sp.]|nr:redoxin domain-containing protein [Candidatus Angelobacter sp.]